VCVCVWRAGSGQDLLVQAAHMCDGVWAMWGSVFPKPPSPRGSCFGQGGSGSRLTRSQHNYSHSHTHTHTSMHANAYTLHPTYHTHTSPSSTTHTIPHQVWRHRLVEGKRQQGCDDGAACAGAILGRGPLCGCVRHTVEGEAAGQRTRWESTLYTQSTPSLHSWHCLPLPPCRTALPSCCTSLSMLICPCFTPPAHN